MTYGGGALRTFIVEKIRKLDGAKIILFGSQSREEAIEESDMDVLIIS